MEDSSSIETASHLNAQILLQVSYYPLSNERKHIPVGTDRRRSVSFLDKDESKSFLPLTQPEIS
jgi:hypothetical protein